MKKKQNILITIIFKFKLKKIKIKVRDGKLSSEEYIDIFTRLIEKEPSDDLLVN